MSSRKKQRLTVRTEEDFAIVALDDMEIWDGADLALLRETLTKLIVTERLHSVGVNMASVKYIPSGYFGLLYDWREQGIRIQLFNPQAHVQRMLWFQQFLQPITDGCFLLLSEPKQPYEAGLTPDWATTRPAWAEDEEEENAAARFGVEEDDDEEFALAEVGDGYGQQ